MLSPRDRDERADVTFFAEIQKPSRWHIVDANKVHPSLDHQIQITNRTLGGAEILAIIIGSERTVGDALDEKLFVTFKEKFSAHAHWLHISHYATLTSYSCKRRGWNFR